MNPRRNFFRTLLATLYGLLCFWRRPAKAAELPEAPKTASRPHKFKDNPDDAGRHRCSQCQAWIGSGGSGGELDGRANGNADPCPWIDTNQIMCTDIFDMTDAVARHTRMTGDRIVSADWPERLYIGFMAVPVLPSYRSSPRPVTWYISIVKFRESLQAVLDAGPPPGETEALLGPPHGGPRPVSKFVKAQIFQTYFQTQAGKQTLARSFPGQKR